MKQRSKMAHSDLVSLARARSQHRPEKSVYTFLRNGEAESAELRYGDLDRRARAIAAVLQQHEATEARALLLFPAGLEFISAFFGCLYAGVVGVPTYPPTARRPQPRLQAIARDAGARFILTTEDVVSRREELEAHTPELREAIWIATDAIPDSVSDGWIEHAPGGEATAFLQYTSGSTSDPKGVVVTHGNLLHNEELIRQAFGQSEESVIVGWLPLYHDMGLIGNVLQPLYADARCILMSPLSFLQQPARWLRAVSRYRATTSGGPNFAYDLCARKATPELLESLDLSSWQVAFNGAEPVRSATLERFAEVFAPCGFRREAFYPCYGLAEATLLVTGGALSRRSVGTFDAQALAAHRAIESGNEDLARPLVSSGASWGEQRVVIADPETGEPSPPDRVGEIWVSGPSIARGYWGRPEETARLFAARLATGEGPFLRTGDLGFVREGGDLFVTGRLKDLIILRGRNLYPQDLEQTAESSHPALRPGCSAAFSVDTGAEEKLVLVHELERGGEGAMGDVGAAVRRALAEEHEVQVHEIVFLPHGSLPKTSSGKIQRQACRRLYLAGELPEVGRSRAGEEADADTAATLAALPADWLDLPVDDRRSLLEDHLAARLSGVLRMPAGRIERDQPLTAFGLDSLASVEVQEAVETSLGLRLELADLLRGPTLRQLAADLLDRLAEAAQPSARAEVPLVPGGETGTELPLSHGQRALWFLQRLDPSSSAYNIAAAARVGPGLDPAILRQAFAILSRHHDALRLSFAETPSGPVQRVVPERLPEILEEDARLWSEERLAARLREIADRPFDLADDPLLRVAILATDDGRHVVLLVVHHVVADLWSMAVLVRDLARLIPRLRGGDAASLEPPALRYADWVMWQLRQLEGETGERLWAGWQERLHGELPVIELPLDHPRPPLQTFHGGSRGRRLPPRVLERMKEVAREQGATVFATLLSAFAALLHRYSGQTDVLIGSPTAGRGTAGLRDVIGYFVNPVPLRIDLSGAPSFRELAARVRDTALEAFRLQDLPFPLLVERLQPERDPSRSPLFQVMLTMQRSPLGEVGDLGAFALGEAGVHLDLAGWAVEPYPLETRAAQLDLELLAAETPHGLSLVLIHNTDLVEPATAERLLSHLEVLTAGALAEPGRLLSELPLLTAPEREQLLILWNDTAAPLPLHRCLPELFAEQASRTPGAVAAVCEGRELTYGELHDRSLLLARELLAAGCRPETPVAVWAERSLDFLTAVLGILAAGGAYLPLDPRQPERRLTQIVRQSGATLILASAPFREACAAALGEGGPAVLSLEELLAAPSGMRRAAPLPSLFPEQLAYILFTSGSTGSPKGAMLAHQGMLNHLFAKVLDLELTAGDRVAQTAAPTFDISVWQFLAALLVGGRIEILPDEIATDPVRLLAEVERGGITILETVPSLMREVLQEAASGSRPALPGLRWLIPTGEALPPDLARSWHEHFPSVPLLNAYGPTECSDDVTHHALRSPLPEDAATTPIGRPVANLRLHVLDRSFHLVPVGVPGEICVAGVGVGRGYLQDPWRTAAAFTPDPFAPEPGGRLYRTGDLGRRRPDGALEFLGRLDDQVKVRGHRIELGEIEAVLAEHGGVDQVSVAARRSPGGEERLVAWWTGGPAAAATDRELRDYLKQRLPDAMIPAVFLRIEAFPLSPNGKVDRRALPEPDWSASETAAAVYRDEVQVLLAGIVATVLGREEVGPDENFFEAGGHSLLAIRVMARVRQTLGVELPLATFFETPTVAGLARAVAEGTGAATLPPIERLPRGGSFPQSFSQARLWFLYQLAPRSVAYNSPFALRFEGVLDRPALAASLGEIVRRHEVLRTVYATEGGEPVQRVGEAAPVPLPVMDLTALPPGLRATEESRLILEEARIPLDIVQGPVVRTKLIAMGPEEHLLLITVHQIAADGWSMGVIVRETETLYTAFAGARGAAASPLPELPLQFADYAAWQRRWLLESGQMDRQLAYWREQLRGAPPLLGLATDRPRPEVQSFAGARLDFGFSRETTHALQTLSRAEGATPFMTLLAAFQILLSRHSGQTDIVVGSPVANRRRVELEGLVGFFANTVALRTDLARLGEAGEPTFRDLLARVREVTLGALMHQDLPFEKLVEELQPERRLSYSPIFQVLYVLQNTPDRQQRYTLPDLTLTVLESEDQGSQFDITLALEEDEGRLLSYLSYSTDLFDAATIERLWSEYQALVEAILADPSLRLPELPLLREAERQALAADAPPRPGRERVRALREEGLLPSPEDLRDFLRAGLPEYMVPSAFVFLDSLPLTYSGKRDLRGLPEPDAEDEGEIYVAPRTPMEELLANLLAGLLKRERVGVESNFFELGGHSLLVMQLTGRIQETLGVEVTLENVFAAPTVAGLAACVAAKLQSGAPGAVSAARRALQVSDLRRASRDQPLPLSFAQERLWVMNQVAPGSPVYNVFQALHVTGPLSAPVLERCLLEVIRRHEVLRTRFATARDGRPVQIVEPEPRFALARIDLSGLDPGLAGQAARQLARAESRRPFQLARTPLIRASLLLLAGDERVLLLTMHHIVCDGWSIGPLVREVASLYEAFLRGRPSPLAELPLQYADFAQWQRDVLQDDVLEEELAVWRHLLGEAPPALELPTDRRRPARPSFRGALEPLSLSPSLVRALRQVGQREGATLFMTLLAGFASVLGHCSGQEDLVIGAPVAGRTHPEIEPLIGFFVNLVPLRIDLSGRPSYRELIARVRGRTLAAFDHQEVPFEKLVEAFSSRLDGSRGPLYQAALSMQDLAMQRIALGEGIEAEPWEIDSGVARQDLTLFLWPEEEGLAGTCEYATDLFDRATVVRLLDFLRLVLEDMAADAGRVRLELPPLIERRAAAPAADLPRETNLTAGQLLFWFAPKLQPDIQLYFDRATTAFTLRGPVEGEHFERAFRALLAGCDSLRTRVVEAGGIPLRFVGEPHPEPLDHVDLSGLADPDAALRAWLVERSRRPIDLADKPFDSALLRLAPDRFVWFFNVHHIVADAGSLQAIARQLSHLYQLSREGRLEEAEPLPSFETYAQEERRLRHTERYERAGRYWEEKLAQPAGLNPFYRDPAKPFATRTLSRSTDLGVAASDRARELCSQAGLFSPAVVFTSALFALLYRIHGDRRLRIGTSFTNRPAEFRNVVGLLMNTCPLQAEIEPDETFQSLLRKVQRELIEVSRHQIYPVRNPVGNRAYNVYINYQTMSYRELCGLPVEFELLTSDHSNDHLNLQVSDFAASGSFRIDAEFNLTAFDEVQSARTLEHLRNLLGALLDDPAASLAGASMLSAAERWQLERWNAETLELPRASFSELFSAQAARTPDAVAASHRGERLTYRELDDRVDRLARLLVREGGGPEIPLGLLADRSLEFLTALLAILRAGGVYLPLDPHHPPARLARIVAASGTPLILASPRWRGLAGEVLAALPAESRPRLLGLEGPAAGSPSGPLPPFPGAEGLAYILFTSGSTGVPKGAMVEKVGMLNHLRIKIESLGLTAADVVAQNASQVFDISVWQFLAALLVGGRVHIVEDEAALDAAKLLRQVAAEGITVLEVVPSLLAVLLDVAARRPGAPAAPWLLRWLVSTGEALPSELCRRWLDLHPDIPVLNAYGPTECSDDVTQHAIGQAAEVEPGTVPIGRSLPNMQLHVSDGQSSLLPVGVPGELCVGGICVGRGYLRDPARTAEAFVPDPYSAQPGARLYRTGDLVRRREDGAFEFLGRLDHQVKVRGFRIELGEIESVLLGFPGVREAVLLAREDRPNERLLVAYYVPEPAWGPTVAQLRGYLQSKLPEYMVPAAFVELTSMPLTPNGKVDRRALPAPDFAAETLDLRGAPRTPLETMIASICSQVLQREAVGVHDNFFEIGGNSLLATQVVTLLLQVLPIELDLRQVFEGPTVAQLAVMIEARSRELGEQERSLMSEILAEFEQAMSETGSPSVQS